MFSYEYILHYYDVNKQSWRERNFLLISGAAEFCRRTKCLVRIYKKHLGRKDDYRSLVYSGPARKFESDYLSTL